MKGYLAAMVLIIAGVAVAETNTVCTVTVRGELMNPGSYSMTNAINTLGQLLERIGKPLRFARVQKLQVIRRTGEGMMQTNRVDASAWSTGDVHTITFPLQNGDVIVIPAVRMPFG